MRKRICCLATARRRVSSILPTGRHSLLLPLLFVAHSVFAADPLDKPVQVNIPTGTALDLAVIQLGEQITHQTGMNVMLASNSVGQQTTDGLRGTLPAKTALTRLLRGSGLSYEASDNTVTVLPVADRRAGDPQPFRTAQAERSAETSTTQSPSETPSATSKREFDNNKRQYAQLEEVVVTAQKREERLQNVPIAISAFNQDTINRLALSDVQSLSRTVPSLSFYRQFGEESRVSLRGISTGPGLAPSVGTYVDETPIDTRGDTFAGTSLIDLFDVDRVEVLRGPQGTLFGASSMGGTIRMITSQPDPTKIIAHSELDVSDTHRGDLNYAVKGALNVPVGDDLAFRVVATRRYMGGFVDRSLPGDFAALTGHEPITKRNENKSGSSSFRLAARWAPSNNLIITPSFLYQRTKTEGYPIAEGPVIQNLTYPHTFTEPGTYQTVIGALKLEEDLGFATLVSATSYLDKIVDVHADWDEYAQFFGKLLGLGLIVPPPKADLLLPITYRQWAQELRLTSSNKGPVRWIIGGYFNQTDESNRDFVDVPAFTPVAGTARIFSSETPLQDRQFAAFGEVTYVPIKEIEITAGLRAYKFHQTLQVTQGGLLAGPNSPKVASDNTGVNPKFTLAYKLNEDLNFYATLAKGFRAGGANPGHLGSSIAACTFGSIYKPSYDPDSVWNHEVGAKMNLLGGRATLNAAAYLIEWKNIQGPVPSDCNTFTANIGSGRTQGVELEPTVKVSDHISFYGGLAYTDAHIRTINPVLLTAGVGIPGQRIVDVPRLQFSFGGELETALGDTDWLIFLSPTWQYVGSMPSTYALSASGAATRPAYHNVDVTAGIRHGSLELSLYGRNLTNDLQIQGLVQRPLSGNDYFVGRPRTIGITLRYAYY